MGDSNPMLQLQVSGQLNGQPARVTISVDTEQSLDIQDVGVDRSADTEGAPATDEHPTTVSTPADAEGASTPAEGDARADDSNGEPAGLDALFPENGYDVDDLPPMTAGTKQYKVGRVVLDANDVWLPARDILEELEEHKDGDEWNRSIVTSHIHSLLKKDVLERRKDESLGVYEYRVSDLGRATLKHAESGTE